MVPKDIVYVGIGDNIILNCQVTALSPHQMWPIKVIYKICFTLQNVQAMMKFAEQFSIIILTFLITPVFATKLKWVFMYCCQHVEQPLPQPTFFWVLLVVELTSFIIHVCWHQCSRSKLGCQLAAININTIKYFITTTLSNIFKQNILGRGQAWSGDPLVQTWCSCDPIKLSQGCQRWYRAQN